MSNLKNIFKLSILGVASLSLLSGAGLILSQDETPFNANADTIVSVNNTTPDFFKATWKNNENSVISDLSSTTSPLVLANENDYINLRFDTKSYTGSDSEPKGPFLHAKEDDDDQAWDCFQFTDFTLTRDNKKVDFTKTSPNFITTQNTSDGSYFYSAPVGNQTMDFDLDIKLGTGTNELNGKTLTLTSEGIYEITISYTMYSTIDNGQSWESVSTGPLVWSFMLFNHDTYLETGLNKPRVAEAYFQKEDNTYFYHYDQISLPYIDYDPTRYNLTVTKSINQDEQTVKLVYDNYENVVKDYRGNVILDEYGNVSYNTTFVDKYKNNGLFDIKLTNSRLARLYFKDLGKYTLSFELVYSTDVKETNVNTYILPHSVENKVIYMFGYQSTYTRFNTTTNTNEYPEFKTYNDNYTIDESADITSKISKITGFPTDFFTIPSDLNPVTTNQAPVKFKEYGNFSNAYLYPVTSTTTSSSTTTLTLGDETQITATKNVSLSSSDTEQKYLAIFEYSFENYITGGLSSPNEKFYQVFYFELTNATPTVEVRVEEDEGSTLTNTELPSRDYTNKNVYIYNNYSASTFNSVPIIRIDKYDYLTKQLSSRYLEQYDSIKVKKGTTTPTTYTIDNNGDLTYYKITGNGNYTINIFSGRNGENGTPITRKFNIDNTDIESVNAYSVRLKNTSEYAISTSNIDTLTNQPLIFTWKDIKASGAGTKAYYKYYPLEADETNYNDSSVLSSFLNNVDSMPVSYTLNLNANPSWIRYTNAEGLINSSSISPSYVKTAAGLYVLYIIDDAGNEAVAFYLLDNTTMNFAIQKISQAGISEFSLLSGNDSLSQDATIIWGANKVFKINNTTINDEGLKSPTTISKISDGFDAFKQKYISNITAVQASHQGNYIKIPFVKDTTNNTKLLFKDLGVQTPSITSFEGNRFNIVSSFSLYKSYITDASNILYYLSSTTGNYYQTTIDELEKCYANTITPYEMYLNAISRPLTGSDDNYLTILSHMSDYTESDGKYQSIYNREGVFNFMIRDEANTKTGTALTEILEYLNYPTGYQVINLTSDKSKLSVVYDNNSDYDELLQADFASQEGKIDDEGILTAANKQKNAFYYPTSIDQKLYVSFIPRVVNGDEIIQVESISIEFYPFVNKLQSVGSGLQTNLTYYRALSNTPTIKIDNISFDETATTAQYYELNIVNGQTQEGKYIVTRTYKAPGAAPEGKSYIIDKYDYMKRTIAFIVDRENVISEPDVIEAKTITYTNNDNTIKISTIGSLLVSNVDLGGLGTEYSAQYVEASINSTIKSTKEVARMEANNLYYYNFAGTIESIVLYNLDATPIALTEESSTEQSAQSVVGNGILISVFSETAVSKEFPSMKTTTNGYANFNSGYTFYTTAQSYNLNLDTDKFESRFDTNKRPFMIYIPGYKYTTNSEHHIPTPSEEQSNYYFESKIYDDLSIFKTTNEDKLAATNEQQYIDYYQLTAVIYKDNAKTVYARSNGINENGFLKFTKEVDGTELKEFAEIGKYYVVVTQGTTSMAGLNSFAKNYTFAFNVQTGTPEYSIFDSKGYILEGPRDDKNNLIGNLYTNENKIVAKWTDSSSEYITNIDITKIKLKLDGKTYLVEATRNLIKPNGIEKVTSEDKDALTTVDKALIYKYNETTLLNQLEIDLSKLGCYQNGKEISISLELENPTGKEGIYSAVERTIVVDTSIYDISGESYSTTTEELFNKIKDFSNAINLENLRTFLDISGVGTTDKDKVSFSQTVASDFYRYYAYQVNKDFFTNLESVVENNKTNNLNGKTSVYLRDVGANIYSSAFEETSHDAFFTTNPVFNELSEFIQNLTTGHYYEIIECDYAGNLNIYLVYYCGDVDNQEGITYKLDDTSQTITNTQIATNKYNVYGNTSLTINEIKFRNDEWNVINVEQSGTTSYYMRTPWLGVGYVYNISSGETVAFSSLLDNSNPIKKSIINISDRVDGSWKTVYFSKANTTNLNIEGVSSDEEGIMIKLPAGDVLTTNSVVVYPIEIKVQVGTTPEKTISNNPLTNISNSASYQSSWIDESGEFNFEYISMTNYLKLTFINLPPRGTRVKYTVTDNFNNTISTIHLFGSDYTDSYEYTGNLYQEADANGNLYNYVQNSFTYKYNNTVYNIKVYDENGEEITDLNSGNINSTPGTTINSITFSKLLKDQIDKKFEIRVFDVEDDINVSEPVKSVFVRLYDVLPRLTSGSLSSVTFLDQNGISVNDKFNNYSETVKIGEKDYSCYSGKTFASVVTLSYTNKEFDIPYSAFIYKEGEKEFNAVESGYKITESGIYYIMFRYLSDTLFTNEYRMYKLEVLDSTSSFYYVTLDGNVVKAEKSYFTDSEDNKQYANYYLVNVAYSEKARVKIETNVYQQIQTPTVSKTITKQGVTTVIYIITNKSGGNYPDGVSPYSDYVVISYIPTSTSPSSKFSYILEGNDISIVNESKAIVAMAQDSTDKSLILKWSTYFGLQENKINLEIEKDGKILDLPIYYEGENVSYTILEISGLYKIRIIDNAGNIQKFGANDYFELIYLKDAHFTMIHQENGEEIKTEAIDKGVFNGTVKLVLENIETFYLPSSENKIIAKKNGIEFTPTLEAGTTNTYLFSEVGYYQVSFKATASNGTELRSQVYTFTIINPNESRYAFSYSAFDTYMITKVLKDDGITDVKDLSNVLGNKDSIYVSYYNDDSTGRWTVTIDTNKKLNTTNNETTKFTFSFLIRSALPPIDVSLPEGSTTTDTIKVSFNAVNIYNTVGDCILTCGNDEFKINASTCEEIGVVELNITSAGTYFIQVSTESGNLLYSYMVVKTDPLNTWAIIAIVLGGVVVIAVIIIVVKLRKRIKVK